MRALVDPLQDQVKAKGLWAIFLDRELGGPGFGQLKLALLNEIIGRYSSAPSIFGCQAPDTGNMEILAAYGTEVQKERWLYPLMNQKIWSAYSMTEPQGGSDPNLFITTAVRDGEEWVINGEKWFTSAGRHADILLRDVHQRHVHRAPGHPGGRDHGRPAHPRPHRLPRRAGAARPSARARRTGPRCWPSGGSGAGGSTTPCGPSPSASGPST